jgi:Carboxypeptidase regulatory-like domain/TonB-dependent Receptor Plug Domain
MLRDPGLGRNTLLSLARNRAASLCLTAGVVFLGSAPALSASALPQSASDNALSACVRGTVADANGSVLEGVTVELRGPAALRAFTDKRGSFSFAGVAPGIYRVIAMRGGYQIAGDSTLAVSAGAIETLNIELAAQTLSTLRLIGQTRAGSDRARFNTTAASTAIIPQNAFLDQGQTRVARILDQTPGIVTGHASSAFPGSSGASPVALVSPSIRGGLPWETATLVDGHAVAVHGDGFYWLQSLNAFALDSVEVTKGPGAAALVDSDAINGSINFRTLDPTAKPAASLTLGIDNYGGQLSNFLSRGTTANGRFGWVLDYTVRRLTRAAARRRRSDRDQHRHESRRTNDRRFPVAANPYSAASPPPGILNSYQGSKTSLIACCEALNSTYTSKTELLKLRYSFSPASVLTASYFGNQLYTIRDGYGTEMLATTFAPGSAYSGPLPKGPAVVSAGSYFPPNEQTDQQRADVQRRVSNDTRERHAVGPDLQRLAQRRSEQRPDVAQSRVQHYVRIGKRKR